MPAGNCIFIQYRAANAKNDSVSKEYIEFTSEENANDNFLSFLSEIDWVIHGKDERQHKELASSSLQIMNQIKTICGRIIMTQILTWQRLRFAKVHHALWIFARKWKFHIEKKV